MPWTIPTYGGQVAFDTGGAIKTSLFELCRGVNQRQGHLGFAKTQWYRGDGTQGADLPIGDFLDLLTTGSSASTRNLKTNLSRIYGAIRAMAPSFYKSGSALAQWTVAELETAIGSTLSPALAGMRVMDPVLYQAAQDALDELTYLSKGLTHGPPPSPMSATEQTVRRFSGSYRSGFADAPTGELNSAQAAWDARSTHVDNVGTGNVTGATIVAYDHSIYEEEWDVTVTIMGANHKVDFSGFGLSFPVSSTWYTIQTVNDFAVNSVSFSFSGASDTVAPGAGGTVTYSGNVIPLDEARYLTLSTDFQSALIVPSSPPQPELPAISTVHSAFVQVLGVLSIYDISSGLADQ